MPSRVQRRIPVKPLAGGVRTDRNPALLADGQSPNAKNVEFSNESIRSSRGSRKLGNQIALAPALRCQPDPAYSPLYIESGKSVPLRGYLYLGYDPATDIGGDFTSTGTFPTLSYHNRRGRTFEKQLSFRLPEDFRMGERPARGEGAPNPGNTAIENGCGYDEGLDDCTILLQKGGDRNVPMSWALGIVNAGNHAYNVGIGSAKARKSNYFLVFMWLDAPEWGSNDQTRMRYDLATFANNATGAFSTHALRAFILDGRDDTVSYALEPGRSYHVSLAVTLDSLTGGTTWAHDGRVDLRLMEDFGPMRSGSFVDSGGGGTTTNLSMWKGPTDSLRYLAKFGVRYSGKDAEHVGLGYRTAPWNAQGFIPYGFDSAAMEHKGFRMADVSLNSVDDLYGVGAYGLTCTHPVAGNTFLSFNTRRSLTEPGPLGGASWAQAVIGVRGAPWVGYGGNVDDTGAPATNFNAEALRGYRIVFPRSTDGTMNALRGGRMTIESYSEAALNDYRLEVQDVEFLGVTWAGQQPVLIQAFRWNQQAVDVQEERTWKSSRDYTNPRVVWSMRNSLELDDETEPELSKLQSYRPINDAGGRVVTELVRGRDAFLAPYGLGLSRRGREGENELFLSGEGEALCYDLSENPIFKREMVAMLRTNSRGFAIELSCILPEAYYGVATTDINGSRPAEYEASYCPDLVSWAVKDADDAGTPSAAPPLLTMGHHSWWSVATGTTPERSPQGFHVDVHTGLDSEKAAMTAAVIGFTRSGGGAGNWDDTAPWVGKRITIQVGVQPSPANRAGTAGKANEYRVYIAATPKGDLKFAAGENPQAEFAYFSDAAIMKKDLPRLVVTIGGGWNPSLARGYTELSARMIVDGVRIYGATAAGELPLTTGLVTAERRGKILGRNSLPQRKLTLDDILQPLGVGTKTAGLEEGSATVTAPGGTSFFTQLPEATLQSVREKFLVPVADTYPVPSTDEIPDLIQEFYWIQAVAAGGASLTLATPYNGPSSRRAGCACSNLIGYMTFDAALEDIIRHPLTLGSGQAYKPGTTTTKELVLSPPLFEQFPDEELRPFPSSGKWRVRVASPFTNGGLVNVLPRWVRGIVAPRRGRITGIHQLDATPFVAARGALFNADDRWRERGPTAVLKNSLAFLGRAVGELEFRFPRAGDGVRFDNYSNAWPYWNTGLHRAFTWVFDFWVDLDDYAEFETLLWLGCEQSHLLLGPAANDNRRGIGIWLRLNDGRPEIVRESSGNFAGGAAPPPAGRYTATAGERIALGRHTHVRFWLQHELSAAIDVVKTPAISINGRRVPVVVNANETGLAAGDWIRVNNGGGLIGSIGDPRNVLYLGVARDSVSSLAKSQFTALAQLGGREFPGSRVTGRMHPLIGRLAGVCVWRAASGDALVSGFPDFDPYTLNYTGRAVRFRADLQEGVGHKTKDAATETEVGFPATTPGLILSHPLLELHSEFGASEAAPSFVAYGPRVYAANGGRVAQVTERAGGDAGVVPPTTAPRATVEKHPIWEPNFAPAGSSSVEQDPIAEAAVGAGQPIYHYSSHGNNYLRQRWHEDMRWTKDDAVANTPFDIFGFKSYWRPREVKGRSVLWSARGGPDSGGAFLECVDGKARLGWYDTALKKVVSVETNAPVFRPGYWYYLYLRKAFPMQDLQEGNWLNSYFSNARRRRASFTIGVAGWAVGDIVRNGAATKRAVVTKVYAGRIEYMLFQADTDFVNTEAVNNGGAATGTITSTPHHMTGDALIVRELPKTSAMLDTVPWSVKAGSHRTSVSLTSDMPRSPNTTAIGQVTPAGILYTGAAGGIINVGTMAGVAAAVSPFTPDMVGMQFQFAGATANAPEKVYRIDIVATAFQIGVLDETTGLAPNLAAFVNRGGGVFQGVELVKSPEFNSSKAPDQGNYDTEFMGSALAEFPENGVARMNGEWASFAWHVVASNVSATAFYSGFNLFETATPAELSEMGTDSFPFAIFSSSGRPGELHVDTARAFTAVDIQPYAGAAPASTQPNSGLEVAPDPTASSGNAEALLWRYITERSQSWGRRLVRVTFFDQDQDVESNPGPALIVQPGEEDRANPAGLVRLLLDDLPISHQRGRLQRHVYVSDAEGVELFRQVIVPDNVASSCSLELDDDKMDFAKILDFDNPSPPNCGVLGIAQDTLFCGDVEIGGVVARDLVLFSKPFLPAQFPFSNVFALVSSRGDRVTAMASANGRLLVFKRDSVREVDVREGAAFLMGGSDNVGAPGPQAVAVIDGEVYWLSPDRGFYGWFDGQPVWLGENLKDLFEDRPSPVFNVDGRTLERASLAVNRRQDQLVVALAASGEKDPRRRISVEYDDGLSGAALGEANGFRYALYEGPNLTALGAADRAQGGSQRFLGGTQEGFVVELDRTDTQLELAGETPELSHPLSVTLGSGSTTTRLVLSGATSYLAELEGVRGCTLAWRLVDGTEVRATALFSDGSSIWLDRALAAAPPAGTVVTIGAIPLSWTSKWFDLGNSEQRKAGAYIDLVMTPQASGQAVLEVFVDQSTTPLQVGLESGLTTQIPLDLTQRLHRYPLGEVAGNLLQFRIRTVPPAVGVRLEVVELVLRVQDVEQH